MQLQKLTSAIYLESAATCTKKAIYYLKFVSNISTHCDFLIYNKLDKAIELVVEVDGSQHKEDIQAKRDKRKDRLLATAGVKVLRLSTTTIECREKIIAMLTAN